MAETRWNLRQRYGDWALVTGASAGIGIEFARRTRAREPVCGADRAPRGSPERARGRAARAIQNRDSRGAADLAAVDGADRLASAVADLPIAILVNNAGFGYAGRFDKLETERLRMMVRVNCEVPVVLTSRILPGMITRGRGAVIIVGRSPAASRLPLHAVYSATRDSTCSSARVYGASCAEPALTRSSSNRVRPRPSFSKSPERTRPQPRRAAENVVRVTFDTAGKASLVISGWFNWVRANFVRLAPRSVVACGDRQARRRAADPRRPALIAVSSLRAAPSFVRLRRVAFEAIDDAGLGGSERDPFAPDLLQRDEEPLASLIAFS